MEFSGYHKVAEAAGEDALSVDIGKDELNTHQISAIAATSLPKDRESQLEPAIINEYYCL